jgi:hypothetical protein
MFEILSAHRGLASLLFLIIGGLFTYLIRSYVRKNEGDNQKIKNDLLALFVFQALFALFTYNLMPDYTSPKSTSVIEVKSFESVETQLQNHFEDAAQIRQDLRNTTRLTGGFILFSGIFFPAVVLIIFRGKSLKEILEKA